MQLVNGQEDIHPRPHVLSVIQLVFTRTGNSPVTPEGAEVEERL
jgi:hypothetical protein